MHAARQGHLAMFLFSALVAGSFSLGALVARDISPMVMTSLRFVLGSVLVGSFAVASGRTHQLRLVAPWRFLILGSIFASYFVLMFEGLKSAAPVSLAAVFTLTPLMAAGFSWPLLRQRTSRWVLLALAIGAAGALWVIFRADLSALLALTLGKGEAIFFVGCVLHAFYVPLLRKLNRGEGTLATTFGVLCGGAIMLVLVSWGDLRAADWAAMPVMVWVVLGYLMIFATATTFSIVSFASMRLPSSKVLAYTYLTPSWVILWELALGHSAPPLLVLGGVGLTLVALTMLLRNDA
ncbi:MAG: DMT family transporter [Rhodobacteraceae bacterium]|nr:DMT family transporter [Paracoccaceae bacterium]